MAKVNVCGVKVLDSSAKFCDSFKFEITLECFEPLPDDLEFKLTYVGSAEDESRDQILDTILVGPIEKAGRMVFVFEADPPNKELLPPSEVVGVTVLLLTCDYRSQRFLKIGYYVAVNYEDPQMQEEPPEEPQFHLLRREIFENDVRVTKYPIKWDDTQTIEGEPAAGASSEEKSPAFEVLEVVEKVYETAPSPPAPSSSLAPSLSLSPAPAPRLISKCEELPVPMMNGHAKMDEDPDHPKMVAENGFDAEMKEMEVTSA